MSIATEESTKVDEAAVQWPFRLSYETYERLGEQGMVRSEDHVILLDGILVQTVTKGPEHSSAVIESLFALARVIPDGWHVRPEQPIALRQGRDGDSAPEPDLAIVAGRNGDYQRRHPEPHEVALVVEIATSSAAFRTDHAGLRRYAHAGIPTVLIVALHQHTLHIFTEPSGPAPEPGYAREVVQRSGELLEVVLRNQPGPMHIILGPIAVASFFPPTP